MVKINLFPHKEKAPIALYRDSFVLILTLTLLLLVMTKITLDKSKEIKNLQNEIESTKNKIETANKKLKKLDEYKDNIEQINKKISIVKSLKEKQTGPVTLFNDLSIATPTQLWLDSIENRGDTLVLKGMAFTPNSVSEFMQNLTKSKHFSNVELDNIKQIEKEQKKLQIFIINCSIINKLQNLQANNS